MQVFAQASAVLHDVRCVLQHIQTVLPLLHDGLHNVGQLLQARRVDAVPLVARNDVADDVRKFFSVGDDTSQVSHQPQRHFLCHASCCKIPVLVAVRLALALPEVHQELDTLRPDVSADGCQERNAQPALGLVVILRVSDSLVVFCLTGTLPQRIVGLRAVRLEHRKRPRHRILALAQRALVHLVRGGLTSRHRFVEYFCNLLIERAAAAVDLLLASGLQLRELSSYLVFRPRPQHARGPAVHGGDRSAAEDKIRELVCLCPVRIFLQLLGLRRRIAQRSPVQLLRVLLNQAPVDALYLSRRREVLEVQPRTRQWNRTQLLKDDGWVCPEHGADVIAEDFFCAHAHAVACACGPALQRLHQVLDVLQAFVAPVVGDNVRHGVFPLAPVEQCLPVSCRNRHAHEPCCLLHMALKGVEGADVVARILGELAALQIADAFCRCVVDTQLALGVVGVGVDRRIIFAHSLVVPVENVGNAVDLLLGKHVVVLLQRLCQLLFFRR